jgi:TatA/E family protein of Tat protein translocase
MFALGPGELFLILVVAFLVLGPDKLPEAGRSLGKFMAKINQEVDKVKSDILEEKNTETPDKPAPKDR